MSTLSQQILSRASGRSAQPGDLITLTPDRVMLHDSIAPSVIRILKEQLGVTQLSNPDRVVVVIDHVAPAANLATAENQAALRKWVREQGIKNFFESGNGICHQLLIQEGLALPGEVVVGTDSHSTTYGAVGAFGTGMGSTDVAVCLAAGRTWMRVPEAIRVQVRGSFTEAGASNEHGVFELGPKDLALEIIRRLGAAGATYASIEIFGLDQLSIAGRMTIASMAVEAGAKAGLIWPGGLLDSPSWMQMPDRADYISEIEIDLAELQHRVARPGRVDDLVHVSEVQGLPIDVVYVGTCTNGRVEDLQTVARVLAGRKVATGTRLLVVPASAQVMQEVVEDGTAAALLSAGATFGPPGCGACIGRHMGVLAPGEVAVFTGNRNFTGRMGSPQAQIYLASPAVAAETAATGRLNAPSLAHSTPHLV